MLMGFNSASAIVTVLLTEVDSGWLMVSLQVRVIAIELTIPFIQGLRDLRWPKDQ